MQTLRFEAGRRDRAPVAVIGQRMPESGHDPDGDADALRSDPLIDKAAWRKGRRTVSRTKERSE